MIANIALADVGLVIAGLVLLIWGADRFVYGAAASARNLGIAPLLIGKSWSQSWLRFKANPDSLLATP
jgi:Ca2+/Na+ antiporter